jgi:hypothetical protein
LERAISGAPEQISRPLQGAIDAAADGINSARARLDELNKPGPDYSDTPLTTLSLSPFERREGDEEQAKYFKKRLFYVVNGLDRGSSASAAAVSEVEATVASLLSVSSPVELSWAAEKGKKDSSLAQLNGNWRLVYSSAFAKGNAPALPMYKLGQVYQRISAYSSRLDNTVELYSTINFPSIPGFPKSEPIITTVNLKHQFEAVGGSTVKIKYEETEVKSSGGPNGILGRLPEISLPQLPDGLRPPEASRESTFDVLYMDDDTRISRGTRGELRVFVKT